MLTGNDWSELFRLFPGLRAAVGSMEMANEFRLLTRAVDGGWATDWQIARLAELREFADSQQAWIGERPSWALV